MHLHLHLHLHVHLQIECSVTRARIVARLVDVSPRPQRSLRLDPLLARQLPTLGALRAALQGTNGLHTLAHRHVCAFRKVSTKRPLPPHEVRVLHRFAARAPR